MQPPVFHVLLKTCESMHALCVGKALASLRAFPLAIKDPNLCGDHLRRKSCVGIELEVPAFDEGFTEQPLLVARAV